jgi:hypothetical protein
LFLMHCLFPFSLIHPVYVLVAYHLNTNIPYCTFLNTLHLMPQILLHSLFFFLFLRHFHHSPNISCIPVILSSYISSVFFSSSTLIPL